MPNNNIDPQQQTVSSDTLSSNTSSITPQPTATQDHIWSRFQPPQSQPKIWTVNRNYRKPMTQSKSKESRQLMIWEALVTVGLLVMALWMQTLPLSSTPEHRGVWNRKPSPIYPRLR